MTTAARPATDPRTEEREARERQRQSERMRRGKARKAEAERNAARHRTQQELNRVQAAMRVAGDGYTRALDRANRAVTLDEIDQRFGEADRLQNEILRLRATRARLARELRA